MVKLIRAIRKTVQPSFDWTANEFASPQASSNCKSDTRARALGGQKLADALWPSLFHKLPLELLHHIASFLPPSSAATFSDSSRSLQQILGNIYVSEAREIDVEVCHLMSALNKHIPHELVCYPCKQIYTPSRATGYRHSSKRLSQMPCEVLRRRNGTQYYIYNQFDPAVFDWTMKQHSLGLDPSQGLQQLNASAGNVFGWSWPWKDKTQYRTEARIAADSLFVKVQYVVEIPSGDITQWPFYFRDEIHIQVCQHSGGLTGYNPHPTSAAGPHAKAFEKLQQAFDCWQSAGHSPRSLTQCGYCHTEYSIEIKQIGTGPEVYVYVTKWLELGMNTQDERWKAHILLPDRRRWYRLAMYSPGSLMSVFEDGKPSCSEL